MAALFPTQIRRFPILTALILALVLLLALAGLLQPQYRFDVQIYVPLHTAMHVFALVVSWLVFAIGWNTQDPERAGSVTLLACGFLAVALVDFGHALSYVGMPDFVTPASPEKAITFSLVSRLLAALALLVLALSPRRKLRYPAARDAYLVSTLALVALVYWAVLYHPEVLPRTYVPGTGLTAFKVGAEYVLVALHVVAAVGFYRQLGTAQSRNAGYLFAASIVMALSQSLNALYSHPYDIHNFLSHVYRVIGYVLIYRGVFISEMREPYAVAARLQGELRDSATQLREMSARMRGDIEDERKRISQSLHDEMGQNLTALQLDADWIRQHAGEDATLLDAVDRMQRSIEESATAMRRIVADLRPRVLDDLGITAAVKALVKATSARTGLNIALSVDGRFDGLDEATKTALYRMLQECLTNVIRHAQATEVSLLLHAGTRGIEMRVDDNGRGFSPGGPLKQGAFGLFGLAERAAQLGGVVVVDSAPAQGTSVLVRLPLASTDERSVNENA